MGKSLIKISKERSRRDPKRQSKGLTPLTSQMEDFARDISRRDDSPLEALTEAQGWYINSIKTNQLTFGIGPAGTGKSWCAATLAADALLEREVEQIIITRPAVEAGEELGFLPGELMEKYEPWLTPIRQVLEKRLGKGTVEMFLKSGRIEPLPIAYMRGRSFQNAFVILDEAQNTTPVQMKLVLSRIGENCRVVVDGDPRQVDIKTTSGLMDAVRRLRHIPSVGVVEFTRADIVRSGLVQQIIEAYESDASEEDRIGLETFLARAT